MKSILRLALAVVVLYGVAPGASAGTRFNPLYDDVPQDICGPIDPNTPCYYPVGTGDCPANTSYDSCMKRCTCQYNQNIKKCETDNTGSPALACRQKAQAELDACQGGCLSDHPPLRTVPTR